METRLNLRVRTVAFVHAHVMLQNVQKFPVANLLCIARFFRFIKQKKTNKTGCEAWCKQPNKAVSLYY